MNWKNYLLFLSVLLLPATGWGRLSATGIKVSRLPEDDGYYRAGARLSFRDNGDGTVTDLNTGLMWVKSGYGDIDTDPAVSYGQDGPWRKYNWQQAILYCGRLKFAGYSDWRLPNYKELVSILDLSRTNPAVDETYFPHTRSDFYWTSSVFTYDPGHAWYIYFNLGYANHIFMDREYYLRPVRGP